MDTNAAQSLHFQMLEVDLQLAEAKANGYRELLLSLVGEGAADPTTSTRLALQRFQPRAIVCGFTLLSSLETS
jgi:hypothetical protein